MIHSVQTNINPRIDQPCSLGRTHIDLATLTLIFYYQELVDVAGTWQPQVRQQALTEGVHFSLDATAGTVTLLDHPFWGTLGLWRAADREEPLLYKDQVKAPQYIAASFDHYTPE